MIRVLIDLGNATTQTGTGVAAIGLLNALQRYASDTISAAESGISHASRHFRPLNRILYLTRLKRLAIRDFDDANIVHFTNVYCPRPHKRVPYVTTVHDLDAIQNPEVYTKRYSAYYAHTVLATSKRSAVIVTDTEAVRSMILDRYKLDPTCVASAGIGINPQFTEAVDALAPIEYGESPSLLFVGKLEKKKNLAWLIRTLAKGVRSGALPRIRLVLAGNRGFGYDEIAAAMRDANGIVSWIQNPGTKQVAELYMKASLFVLPSYCEGFGIPLLEAMYCSKPIVASNIPTSHEVAAGAADYFSLGDEDEFYHAVDTALNGTRQEERRSAALQRLKYYSWENLLSKYTFVYTNLATHNT